MDKAVSAGTTGSVRAVDRVCVVIPAHNEAGLIRRCLRSVLRAASRCPVDVEVVVVADGCADATAAVATSMGARVVCVSAGNVGRARAAGSAMALRGGAHGLWLAHTDADSAVPADWLARQLRYARHGADLVAGTVRVDRWRDWPSGLRARYEAFYRRALRDGHRHVHGANLGISARAYQTLGGFAPLPVGEDRALTAAAGRAGLTIAYATDLVVETSGRRHGRVGEGGFHRFLARMAYPSLAPEEPGQQAPPPNVLTTPL